MLRTFPSRMLPTSAGVEAAVQSAIKTFGRLDFANTHAGIDHDPVPLNKLDEPTLYRIIRVNFTAVYPFLKYELAHLMKKGGATVNAASVRGLAVAPTRANYASSKHGIARHDLGGL